MTAIHEPHSQYEYVHTNTVHVPRYIYGVCKVHVYSIGGLKVRYKLQRQFSQREGKFAV